MTATSTALALPRIVGILLLAVSLLVSAAVPAAAQESYVLIVGGLGGVPEMEERFHDWGSRLVDASVDRFGLLPGNVLYLSPEPERDRERIDGESRAERVEAAMVDLRDRMQPGDRLLLVLIGHGSWDGEEARFGLPGPDLTASDFDALLEGFPDRSLAVVNTTSSSGPFLRTLAAPGRIVATATANGREQNATEFGGYFAEALAAEGADIDQDGTISLLEAFTYARTEVERHYEERGLILTEHARLDDDGDGEGTATPTRDPQEGADGSLASAFVLSPSPESMAEGDPRLQALYEERLDYEERLRDLNRAGSQLDADVYQSSLEELLVELAEINREIRELEGQQ